MNELLVWWYLWVNSNYDVLIMSITLLVVGGLVLEVIRLNRRMNCLNADMYHHVGEQMSLLQGDQVKVNVHLAEDIAELQKRLKEVKTKRKIVRK